MGSESPLYSWQPKAVVFDCDGLLMDTEPCWTVAETELFARRGLPFGVEQKALVIGRSLPDAAEAVAELFQEPGRGPAIADELLGLVAEVVGSRAEAMPGAHDLVAAVASAVPVAVASNSPRALLEAALLRGGFTGVFPVSIAADEVDDPKPAPDMYLRACEMLGVAPGDALAFEDSMTGLRSARAAGLRVVGVPTLHHDDFPADQVVASLGDDGLVGWVRRWPI
ncbi:haloacid dehalogenase [Sphaerisporangium krabiense]|uniref:HAD superfamily hydrolase (TIGR01509 family) n=1 Tax=Sphaerisporangium krabiense TaxID=763782 RepID=A0A7W8Z481_9ACTN|nr:HAD family phosphatase [Sphaerisporangium krabiense]MBB5627162.1 HAD superfamily hydrolase (TIGR01509 family) [Sphaerisporangium krabiense]GII65320.1 haloacid dehalogenase [Sphaerisporangium krabiense]